ncbi:unnamed protein product [Fusarium graminearum]|uniref:Chromosome 3, complete genome n=1 Tax=Gibberella zeae (strain ATCC MYA-4620 / CBS 123657 / FGSC 9075 / NRRL 31084 / PH-1) TaxID=229533 RepID=A0A098E4T4_GIBZE|nr:unnamed protein product [Fusarium graminearum]
MRPSELAKLTADELAVSIKPILTELLQRSSQETATAVAAEIIDEVVAKPLAQVLKVVEKDAWNDYDGCLEDYEEWLSGLDMWETDESEEE